MPAELSESVDEAIDRALAQRPDLIARLANVRAKAQYRRKLNASSSFYALH
jgi:hypothetical protein